MVRGTARVTWGASCPLLGHGSPLPQGIAVPNTVLLLHTPDQWEDIPIPEGGSYGTESQVDPHVLARHSGRPGARLGRGRAIKHGPTRGCRQAGGPAHHDRTAARLVRLR